MIQVIRESFVHKIVVTIKIGITYYFTLTCYIANFSFSLYPKHYKEVFNENRSKVFRFLKRISLLFLREKCILSILLAAISGDNLHKYLFCSDSIVWYFYC